ncbi:MAG: hypothetical protein KF761_11235 [Salinibacterium sp.]|nr:hypothetical protein [Salinibacterium sp.]
MSEPKGPIRGFWGATVLILGGCLLLWWSVRLLQSIWPWLVAGAVIGVAAWSAVVWWRWRQRRW